MLAKTRDSSLSNCTGNPAAKSFTSRKLPRGLIPFRGVGNNPDAIPWVRGGGGGGGGAVPLRIIPDLGQRPENVTKPESQQLWDVFHDDVLRSKVIAKSDDLSVENGPFPIHSGPKARSGYVLAGEAPGNDVNPNPICGQSFCGEGSNVVIAGHLWPVFRQHPARERFDLAEGNGLKTARALKAKAETANAAKQI